MTQPDQAVTPTAGDVLDTAEAGARVLKGGVIRLAGYGAGLLASLLGAAVTFRYLGAADYGRFGTVVALVTTIQLVTDLGMTTLGVREYAQRTGEDREQFMRILLGMRLATTAAMITAAAVISIALGYDDQMVAGAILMGIAMAISAVTGTIAIPLQVEIRMGIVTGIDVARQIGTAAAYVLLSLVGANIVAFLGVSIPIYLVVFGTFLAFVWGTVPLRPVIDLGEWASLLRPTIVFALTSAVGSLYVYAAMVLTELVTDPTQTGYFAGAFRVFMIVATFPVLLATTAFPLLSRAARDDHDRLAYAGQRLFEGSALLGGAALIALVLGAGPIMQALGGGDFQGAVPVLRIQGVALMLTFVIASFGFTLMALHRHRAIIGANLIAMAVSVTSVLTLGRAYGAEGAACGVLLGESALAAGYVVCLGAGGLGMRPTLGRAARVLPPLAAAMLCWFMPIPEVVRTALALLIYGAGVLATRAVPDELLEQIPVLGDRLGPTRKETP